MSVLRRAALAAAFVLTGLPAQAFQMTVSGVTYEITLNLGSFDTVNAGPNGPLAATPWWGNSLVAGAFRDEFRTLNLAQGGTLVPDATALYNFAYIDLGANMQAFTYDPSLASGQEVFVLNTTKDASNLFGSPALHYYATGVIVPVPEIDGNALAKALFCLLALGVWLRARRGRQAATA